MKNCWQKLNQSLFEKEKLESNHKYQLFLSPYDVPNAFRNGNSDNHSYFIEFMYIPVEEKTKHEFFNSDAQIDFEVGENTGRVYKITFDANSVQKADADNFKSLIEKAFSSFLESKPKLSQEKYNATKAATLHCLESV